MALNPRQFFRRSAHVWLIVILLVAGCASHPAHAPPATKPQLGMEQLLRLPVDIGRPGVDQVIDALQTLYGVSRDVQLTPYANTATPRTLQDGMTISKVFVNKGPSGWTSVNMGVNLGVTDSNCLSVENAAALIGAKKTSEHVGDGVGDEGHVEYSFDNQEVHIDLVALHPGPHCLGAVWIYKKS